MLIGIVTALHVILGLGIIASVLLQSGRSAGLSGSIAGGAETLFGKKKGLDELLGKVTVLISALFVIISLVLNVWK